MQMIRDTTKQTTQSSYSSGSSFSSRGVKGNNDTSRVGNSQPAANILRSSSQATFARNPRVEYEQQQQSLHNSTQQFSRSRAEYFQSEMCQLMDSFDRLREENAELKFRLTKRNEDLLQRITASLPSECTDKFLKSLSKRSIHLDSVGDVAMSVCMQDQFEATCSKAAQLEMRNMRALIRIQFEKLKAQQKTIADCATRMQNQAAILKTTQSQLSEKSQHILALQHALNQQKELLAAARTSNTQYHENKNTEVKLTSFAVLQQQQVPPHQRTYSKNSSQSNQIPNRQTLTATSQVVQENPNNSNEAAAAIFKQSQQLNQQPEQQLNQANPSTKIEQRNQSEINLNSNASSHRGISSHLSIKDFSQQQNNNNMNRGSSIPQMPPTEIAAVTTREQSSELNMEIQKQKVKYQHSRNESSKENDYPLQIESRIQVQKNNKQAQLNSNSHLNLAKNSQHSSQNKLHSYSVSAQPQPKISVSEYENPSSISQTLRRVNTPPSIDRTEPSSSLQNVLNELQERDSNSLHLPLQQNRRSQSQLLPNPKFQKSGELNRNLKQNNLSLSTESQQQSHDAQQSQDQHNRNENSTKKFLTHLEGSPNVTQQKNNNTSAQRFLQPDSTRSQYSLQAISHRSFNEHQLLLRSPIDELKNSTMNSNINCSSIIMVTEGNSTLLTEPNLSSNSKNKSYSSNNNNNQFNQTARSATSARRSRAERLQKNSGSNQNLSESVNNDYNTFNPQK